MDTDARLPLEQRRVSERALRRGGDSGGAAAARVGAEVGAPAPLRDLAIAGAGGRAVPLVPVGHSAGRGALPLVLLFPALAVAARSQRGRPLDRGDAADAVDRLSPAGDER